MISFSYESKFPVCVEKLFALHEVPDIFFQLLPDDNRIRVLRKDASLKVGSQTHLLMRFGPIQFPWIVKHTAYEKNKEFVDEQIKGPFRTWKHKHLFMHEGPNQSKLKDEIFFTLPVPFLTHPLLQHWVLYKLKNLFQQRHQKLKSLINTMIK